MLTMLNIFAFRIAGRLSDPLVGVHGLLVDGSDHVVPGCAGLSSAVQLCPKIYDIFHKFYITCLL